MTRPFPEPKSTSGTAILNWRRKHQLFTNAPVIMTNGDDWQLVQACLQGDTKAFETLIERYQKPIFNLALRMVRDTEDAEDVTQTVFLKAFEKLNTFNPKYKFFSWIYRMTINESINLLNQKKPHDVLDGRLPLMEKTPDEQYEQEELVELIGAALMRIPVDYRAVLVLRHFGHLSYREIGFVLDAPEKTVKSRLYTARQQLRDVLLKQGLLAS